VPDKNLNERKGKLKQGFPSEHAKVKCSVRRSMLFATKYDSVSFAPEQQRLLILLG